ncbi:aminoacyl-tRNA hydrolase [Candidatus Parcubacteria bacterium]|nr:aminoacyl-tRNA hydrolase [Candidatus Parcubacteria bacterium]
MMLIIGLGNPGAQFNHTRHNAGFEVLDFFAQKNGFPEFSLSKKYEALISEKDDVILAKPQTFMNESGKTAAAMLKNTTGVNLVVVHDEIDLELGKMKFSKDSGAGGHKGVASIIQHVGNNNFIRLKIGVATDDKRAEEVVLEKFSPAEQETLQQVIEKASEALDHLINNGIEKTMNEYHK